MGVTLSTNCTQRPGICEGGGFVAVSAQPVNPLKKRKYYVMAKPVIERSNPKLMLNKEKLLKYQCQAPLLQILLLAAALSTYNKI